MGKKSAACAIFVSIALLAAAQESGVDDSAAATEAESAAALLSVPVLPEEASRSLLSLQLGDADVDLFAQGYWEASLVASQDVGLGENSGISSPTLLFQQTPDLWLTLTLMDRWFLEARLSADGDEEVYAIGYRGGEEDFLKEVRIGNKDVSFPDLPYISLGSGISSSFGISAYGEGPIGSAHFLFRYDQAQRITQTWVGDREMTETDYNPSDYEKGHWFALPNANVSNVELYIESDSGTLVGNDTRKYRKMAADEYSVSSVLGRVDLEEAVDKDRRLLVYYDELDVDAVILTYVPGEFPFYAHSPAGVTGVASGPALVLYEEGYQEGFLIANRYAVPSSASVSSAKAYVENVSTGLKDDTYTATVLSGGYVQVTKGDVSDPQQPEYSHPFWDAENMTWVYDPDATKEADDNESITEAAPAYSKRIVLETYGTSGDFVLDSDEILEGSIEVLRNGVQDHDFSYNKATHTVTLDRDPGISETIAISYLIESSDSSAGILSGGLGGIFNLAPGWKAWTAFGMRWGVPGTGYSEGDKVNSGNLTLSVGAKGGTPDAEEGTPPPAERYAAEAALAVSYNREDAVGYHRVAGMEDTSSWTSPFKETTTWPSGLTADQYTVADESLETLFPSLYTRFHSGGETQKALQIEFASAGGSAAELVRYVDTITAGNYQTFAFFARAENIVDSGSTPYLTVAISGNGAVVSVKIPLNYLDDQWRLFLLRYDGVEHLYYLTSESGTETRIDGLSGVEISADSSKSGGKITITVEGVDTGSVFIDELFFQDPVGQVSVAGRGKFAWKKSGTVATIRGTPVLRDPDVAVRISGTASDEIDAAGYVDGSIGIGPLNFSLNAQQGLSGGTFSDGAFSHGIELPLKEFSIKDTFEFSPSSGDFTHYDKIRLAFGKFSMKADQTATFSNENLKQEWNLALAAGNAFSLRGYMENDADGAADLSSAYGEAWIQSFRYLLPALENASSERDTEVAGFLKLSGGILSFSAESAVKDASSLTPDATNSGEVRFGWSFPVGKGSVEPYYKREWSLMETAQNAGFLEDWEFWGKRVGDAEYLYRSVPFLELWDDSVYDWFASASSGTESSEYYPEAGIAVSRRYGSRWSDLVVPSKGTFAVRRELESDLDTVTDALAGEISVTCAAVNLFGSRGAYRSTNLYSMDEYSQRLALDLTQYREDGEILTSLTHKALASFYTSRDDSLVAENRFAVAETRDGAKWSDTLELVLTTKPTRTWLGDLIGSKLDAPVKADAGTGEPGRPNFVFGYLDSLRGVKRNLTEVWGFAAALKRPYAYTNRYDFEFTESYATKMVTPGKLAVSAELETYQKLERISGLNYWTFGVDLTLTLKVMF